MELLTENGSFGGVPVRAVIHTSDTTGSFGANASQCAPVGTLGHRLWTMAAVKQFEPKAATDLQVL